MIVNIRLIIGPFFIAWICISLNLIGNNKYINDYYFWYTIIQGLIFLFLLYIIRNYYSAFKVSEETINILCGNGIFKKKGKQLISLHRMNILISKKDIGELLRGQK